MKNVISNLNRKQFVLLLTNVVLVVAFLLVTVFARNSVKTLYSQQEAKRWEREDNSYAQVSAFFSPEKGTQMENIDNIRAAIMETLSLDALNETEGNGRVWIDAYSGECPAEIRKDNNTLSVTAVGVGGEFFQFHPMQLLSGGYITEDDLNRDRIVIDQGLAWAMFGSNDVVGMQLWMGDHIYEVAGVVSVEEDELTETAYGNGNRIYVLYDSLKQQQEQLKITCYEAVLPNPISNYALNTVKDACGLQEAEETELSGEKNPLNFDNVEVIENSNRYETMPMLSKMKNLKLRSMRTNSVVYPYWENVARVVEEQQMILLVIRILLLIVPFVSLVCWLYYLWIHKSWTMKSIAVWMIDTVRDEMRKPEEQGAAFGQSEPEEPVAEEDGQEEAYEAADDAGEDVEYACDDEDGEYYEDVNDEYDNLESYDDEYEDVDDISNDSDSQEQYGEDLDVIVVSTDDI